MAPQEEQPPGYPLHRHAAKAVRGGGCALQNGGYLPLCLGPEPSAYAVRRAPSGRRLPRIRRGSEFSLLTYGYYPSQSSLDTPPNLNARPYRGRIPPRRVQA